MGIDIANKKEEISKILKEADKLSSRGYLSEAKALLDDANKKYPNNYEMLMDIMSIAFDQSVKAANEAQKKAFSEEAMMNGEKILDGCTDDKTRHSAIQILCYLYPKYGKRDKARALAEKMPFIAMSQECLVSKIETGSRKYQAIMNENYALLQFLARNISSFNVMTDSGKLAYTPDERMVIRDKAIALIKLFFEDGDYGFYNCLLQESHTSQARNYAKMNKRDMALSHLKRAKEAAFQFIEYLETPDFVHTSLLFRGLGGGFFSTNTSENSAQQMLNNLKENVYDFLRDEPEFIEIEEKLKEKSGNW